MLQSAHLSLTDKSFSFLKQLLMKCRMTNHVKSVYSCHRWPQRQIQPGNHSNSSQFQTVSYQMLQTRQHLNWDISVMWGRNPFFREQAVGKWQKEVSPWLAGGSDRDEMISEFWVCKNIWVAEKHSFMLEIWSGVDRPVWTFTQDNISRQCLDLAG